MSFALNEINMSLKFYKVILLPEELEANALYFQYNSEYPDQGMAIYMTDAEGSVARKIYGAAETAAAITAALSEYDTTGASKLAEAVQIAISGDAVGAASFDGSSNVTLEISLKNVGTPGVQAAIVTTDAQGRVTASRALQASDLPAEITSNTSGNAATATTALSAGKVANALTINGTAYDGSSAHSFNLVTEAQRNAAGGFAGLDANGLIPASQIPGAIDQIIELDDEAALTALQDSNAGQVNKLYVVTSTGDVYRWGGSLFVKVSDAVSTADVADTLATARNIALAGDAEGSVNFDGSADVQLEVTLASIGVSGEMDPVVTIDSKGRVTGSRALTLSDLPAGMTATGVDFAATPEW